MANEGNKFDDLLVKLGTGRWNLAFFFCTSLWAFLVPYHMLAPVYLAPSQEFTCVPDPNDELVEFNTNLTNACSYGAIRRDDTGQSYIKEVSCQNWTYDDSLFTKTLTTQFDLVCDKEILRTAYSSMYFLGKLPGSIISGYLSDKIGRKITFGSGVVVQAIVGLTSVWYTNFYFILCARFILGFVFPTTIVTGFTLSLEVCEPKFRGAVGVLLANPWAIACIYWGAIAYLIRDWQYLQLAVTLPCVLFIPLLWFYDESPRWLIVNGKDERAMEVLKRAFQKNKRPMPPESELTKIMKEIQMEPYEFEKKTITNKRNAFYEVLYDIFILCRTPTIRKITFLCYAIFIASAVIYYGMSLNGVNYTDDPFLYISLGGLMEIPAYTITVPIINRFGRKKPTAIGYISCGIFILCLAFISKENHSWLVITLAMLGKCCIAASYQIFYLYGNELFPTEVRLQGFGMSTFLSNLFTLICPYITDLLAPMYSWAPSMVFGCLGIMAGFATLCLPETLNKHLPDTVAELEQRGIKKKRSQQPKEKQIDEQTEMMLEKVP